MIIDQGGQRDKAAVPVGTRRRTWIPNERRRQWAPPAMREAVRINLEACPRAKVRSTESVYNCVGLVFASRRTWIDTEQVSTFLEEDEYRPVAATAEVRTGDVVVYRNPADRSLTHVGLVASVERDLEAARFRIYVISQWGPTGEYCHLMEDVPILLGRPTEFWSHRRPIP